MSCAAAFFFCWHRLPVHADGQAGDAGQKLPLKYDVASIRPFQMTGGTFMRSVPMDIGNGDFEATGVTVEDLLYMAYGVRPNRIEGAPGWIGEDLYSVTAKSDPLLQQKLKAMSPEETRAAKRQMLQQLLADRLGLRLRPGSKTGTVYELSVAKGGSKLHASEPLDPAAVPAAGQAFGVKFDGRLMLFHQCSMDRLVSLLAQLTQRDIVDKTGIQGQYDFALRYNPGKVGGASEPDLGDLQDSLADELGLTLKAQRGSVETLVIEHIEKPSEN